MRLIDLTTIDVSDYQKKKKLIIIPFGSIEQHGPHLPTGTDYILAERIAVEAGRLSETIVAPAFPLGFSPGLHPQFPGTISLTSLTYINLILETLQCLHRSGFRDFLLITAHGLNFAPMNTALLDFLNLHNGRAHILGYWDMDEVNDVKNRFNDDNGVHCTIMETSMMLYLYPELVHMEKGVNEYRRAKFILGKDEIAQMSNSGIVAETMKSSAEKGKQYFEGSVNGLVRMAKTFNDEALFG